MPDLVIRLLTRDFTRAGFGQADQRTRRLEASLKRAGSKMKLLGLAAAGVGVIAVSKFAKFDKSIREISTLLGDVTENDIKVMGEEVKQMSIEFGQSIDKMAKAKYDIISAGFTEAADSAELLAVASKLATGGAADVAQTTDVLTSVLNAYGASAKDATKFSDALFTTVRLGKTTVAELSAGLGRAAAVAPTVGVSFDELSAAIATLTAGGQNTDEVMTALTATMSMFLKPSGDLKKAIQGAGFASGTAAVKSVGFFKALQLVTEGATEAELASRFPNMRAMKGVFPLIGTLAEKMGDNLSEMGKKAGATEEAFKKMQEGVQFRIDQMKQRVGAALISIGEALLPVADAVISLVEGFSKLDAPLQTAIITFGALTGVIAIFASTILIALGPIGLLWAALGAGAVALGAYALTASKATKEVETLGDTLETFKDKLDKASESGLEKELHRVRFRMKQINALFKEGSGDAATLHKELRGLKLQYKALQDEMEERANPPVDPVKVEEQTTKSFATYQQFVDSLNEADRERFDSQIEAWETQLELETEYNQSRLESEMTLQNARIEEANRFNQETKALLDREATDRAKTYFDDQGKFKTVQQRKAQMAQQIFLNPITNMLNNAVSNWVQSIENPFARMFAQILANFLKMIIEMTARYLAFKALTSFIPGMGLLFSGGGVVPKIQRAQQGMITSRQQGFDTVPAMLREGEAVIPTEQTRQNLPAVRQLISGQGLTGGGGGGAQITVSPTFQIDAVDGEGVERVVKSEEFKNVMLEAIEEGFLRLNAGGVKVEGEF